MSENRRPAEDDVFTHTV